MPVLDNPKWERFAQGLASGASASSAYEKAGYKANDGNASRLNGNKRVQDRVREIQSRHVAKVGVTIERVVLELERLAQSDIRKLFTWKNGELTLTDSDALDDATAACISEISQTKDGIKIKLHNKLDALDKIGRHLGMWPKQDESPSSVTNNVLMIGNLSPDRQRELAGLIELVAATEVDPPA